MDGLRGPSSGNVPYRPPRCLRCLLRLLRRLPPFIPGPFRFAAFAEASNFAMGMVVAPPGTTPPGQTATTSFCGVISGFTTVPATPCVAGKSLGLGVTEPLTGGRFGLVTGNAVLSMATSRRIPPRIPGSPFGTYASMYPGRWDIGLPVQSLPIPSYFW